MKRILSLITLALLFSLNAKTNPKISFFVELKGTELQNLFADSTLIPQLLKMKSTLRLGLLDFSPECTQTVMKLNQAGVPLIAWLLLPVEEGYWFNMYNGEKATKRYEDFKLWTASNNLKWEGIGIDLELDINDARLAVTHPFKLAWKAYKRLYDNHSLDKGRAVYNSLARQIQLDGFYLESYVISLIFDERISGTSSFQKLFGLVDVKTPNEIPMSYTSVMGNPSIIAAYSQKGQPIALGTTGGGVTIEGFKPRSMTLNELTRDILIAGQMTDEVIIFCLEATTENGWLPELLAFDYNSTPPDHSAQLEKQLKTRKTIQRILIILDHPFLLTLGIVLILSGIIFLIYKGLKSLIILLRPEK